MKTEIVITIKLPLIKRWILRALIGGLLKNLDESHQFYKGHEDFSGKDTASGKNCGAQKRGIEQAINTIRVYCGMNERDFMTEEWLHE